jgi:hypothetical protein
MASAGMQTRLNKFVDSRESSLDMLVFNPVSAALVEPCHNLGLSPNGVTTLSKVFLAAAIASMWGNLHLLAGALYLVHYVLDCVDGKLARAYNQCSQFGMVYDFSSDVVGHLVLCMAQLARNGPQVGYVTLLSAIMFMNAAWYGCVTALACLETHGDDDFCRRLAADLSPPKSGTPSWMVYVFLTGHRSARRAYRLVATCLPSMTLPQLIAILRHFGAGSLVAFETVDLALDLSGTLFRDGSVGSPWVVIGAVLLALAAAHKRP